MIEDFSLTPKYFSILGSEFCVDDLLFRATNESEINDREIPGFSATTTTGDPQS